MGLRRVDLQACRGRANAALRAGAVDHLVVRYLERNRNLQFNLQRLRLNDRLIY